MYNCVYEGLLWKQEERDKVLKVKAAQIHTVFHMYGQFNIISLSTCIFLGHVENL